MTRADYMKIYGRRYRISARGKAARKKVSALRQGASDGQSGVCPMETEARKESEPWAVTLCEGAEIARDITEGGRVKILLDELERSVREVPIEKVPVLLGVLATMTAQCEIRLMQRDSAPPVQHESETLLTVPEVAKQLNLSTYTTYELCRSGKLQAHKCGKSVRVSPSAVADYLADYRP